jgi:hypothetical protein
MNEEGFCKIEYVGHPAFAARIGLVALCNGVVVGIALGGDTIDGTYEPEGPDHLRIKVLWTIPDGPAEQAMNIPPNGIELPIEGLIDRRLGASPTTMTADTPFGPIGLAATKIRDFPR